MVEQLVLGDAELARRRARRAPATTGMSPCERADHRDVELVVGLALGLGRLGATSAALASASVPPSISRSMRILNSLQRRQLADRLGAGDLGEHLERALEPELRVGLGGDREPEVELVVAQVVVRDAGVRVDDLRGAVRVLGVDLGGDEHRRVAERARVEDRRDLADDALVEQPLDARHHLLPR